MLLNIGAWGMFILIFIACSSSKKLTDTTTVYPGKSDSLAGLEIVKNSDCRTCHSIEGKQIGPSFTAIAGKYEISANIIDKLSRKIISGGSGSWGKIPMTPHSSMSAVTAATVVKYILLLKK